MTRSANYNLLKADTELNDYYVQNVTTTFYRTVALLNLLTIQYQDYF